MPSESATYLQNQAANMAILLHDRITITDAWYPDGGGNIEVASRGSQIHSMSAVFAGIRNAGGLSSLRGFGRAILQDREDWIEQGHRTLAARRGVCTDCAAAAAVKFLEIVDASDYEARVEIISSTTHAFVVVDRDPASDVRAPNAWGDDCFIIDVWYQNQFTKFAVAGAFWMQDGTHNVSRFIWANRHRLRLDATIREQIQPLF